MGTGRALAKIELNYQKKNVSATRVFSSAPFPFVQLIDNSQQRKTEKCAIIYSKKRQQTRECQTCYRIQFHCVISLFFILSISLENYKIL